MVGTPTAVGSAALVASLLLAACSDDAQPFRTSESAERSSPTPSAEGDPRQVRIAALLRRIDLSFDDPSSYRFTTRSTGTYPVTIRGQGSLREVIVRHTSTWRRPVADGVDRYRFVVNDVADEMSEIDLDPDGTGETVPFTLPTRVWLHPDMALPPDIDGTTDYRLTFDGEDLVRIEALRDDTIITTRIEHRPYRRIALPAVARQGP